MGGKPGGTRVHVDIRPVVITRRHVNVLGRGVNCGDRFEGVDEWWWRITVAQLWL